MHTENCISNRVPVDPEAVAYNGALLRMLVGWTQHKLAIKSGVSYYRICHAESNKNRHYTYEDAIAIAYAIEQALPEQMTDRFIELVTKPQHINKLVLKWNFVEAISDPYDISELIDVFSRNLIKIRVRFGMTQKNLSEYSGVNGTTLCAVELGDSPMSVTTASRLHKAFMTLSEHEPELREFYLRARSCLIDNADIPKNLKMNAAKNRF